MGTGFLSGSRGRLESSSGGYSPVDIKITGPYTLKRRTLCYMNYISIFKNRGRKISYNLLLRRQTTQLKTGKRFKGTFFTREDPWMHVITRRGFPPGFSGNTLNTSVAQGGSEGKGRDHRVLARPCGTPAPPVGSLGPQVAAVHGDRHHAGTLGTLRKTAPREGAGGVSPVHKIPEREDESTNQSQQRDQWWPWRASEEACGGGRDGRGAGMCPSPSSAPRAPCSHTSTPTLVCTTCCVWVTLG